MNYEIATERKLYNYTNMTEEQEEQFRQALLEEQDNILMNTYGENWHSNTFYMIRHKSDWIKEEYVMFWSIDDAVNCLAIKDGVDLIKFENGNLGYVAYYNGMKDVVEFVARFKDIEDYIFDMGGNEIDVEIYTEGLEDVVFHSLEEIKEHIYNYS